MEGITFGEHGQKALNDFNLVLYRGELLGVFSSHAAVKSDLVGLIAGRLGASTGRLYVDGESSPFEELDPHRLRKVGLIHAVNTLVGALTVSENIFLIRKGVKAQLIDKPVLHVQTRQLMEEFGLTLEPEAPVRDLSGVERCSLEIVKAVALGARIVVLQDMSRFLSDFEIGQLMGLVEILKRKELGFLMVDSSVGQLSSCADRVIVIKNGRDFWTFGRRELTDELMKSCFSREPEADLSGEALAPVDAVSEKSAALIFDQVHSGVLKALSFTLHQGEELCILDQESQGIDEIKALLSGERQVGAGRILVNGKLFTPRNVWEALDKKVAFVVESPTDTMLFPDFTAIENLCFPSSRKAPDFWLNPVYLNSCLREYAQYFDQDVLKKYPDELSAQDLQKLVYCRWHLFSPVLVVCVKPFSSVEKSLEEISAFFIGLLLKKGIAVLVLTSNAAEADLLCRKIVINQKNAPPRPKNDL